MIRSPTPIQSNRIPDPCTFPSHIRKINNYLLTAKIGSGSSSTVYLGIDTTTNLQVAVKRIKLCDLARSDNGFGQLEREIQLIRRFDHPHILKLIEVLHDNLNAEVYIILEYAQKGSLGGYIARGQPLSKDAVFGIVHQIAIALKYLHSLGYVHQDIKPGNVLINATGQALLADFGIGHTFASAGMVVGSPAFQAPEALDDRYEEQDESLSDGPQKEDVWALGVTLYQLLFMTLPYFGRNLYEVVNDIKGRPLKIPEGTDRETIELLNGMLAVDPKMRFGIEDLLRNPLLNHDRRYELPPEPQLVLKKGSVVCCRAEVCEEGFSFASLPIAVHRRFSQRSFGMVTKIKNVRAKTMGGIKPMPIMGDEKLLKK
jgi:serine/threonine protein kinase